MFHDLNIEAGSITSVTEQTTPTFVVEGRDPVTGLPPCTVVRVVLHPAQGSTINVEVWLPERRAWNGRFLGLGNGGAAGRIDPISLAKSAANGYAVATTDMGTAPNAGSGIGNTEVWRDFGYRATHLMTGAAKRIVAAKYGREPEYSYFSGRSTGGQQALQEAQRHPEDYDGIVAALPAHCRTPLHAYFLWNDQILSGCPFTPEQEANVIAAGNEYMAPRETPAAAGKFVSDPRCSSTDIENVVALARQKDSSLTDRHAEALRKLFEGPRHAVTGERISTACHSGVPSATPTATSISSIGFLGRRDSLGTSTSGGISMNTRRHLGRF